ncbi:hypothetical protein OPT61_g3374 [Boeremia exigua]|uniref:Uncharacterized protein n=1 Tax=Boeremia exigua TaxID=749465 RepID=A0ACC2IIF8_9PLEO|nr:hypothetical protein OPT61_g3374 [Boeremia exigua]
MATISKNFLDVDDKYPTGKKQRSRSSGHVDRLEEQERLERRDLDRQVKKYHDNTRHVSTGHQRTKSDLLSVPTAWDTHPRPRSSDRSDEQYHSGSRNYRVEEVKPGPRLYEYDLNPEAPSSSQLPVPIRGRPLQPDKPKNRGPPIVIQDNPPLSSKTGRSPLRSLSASPHSPTAQPALKVQYETLQNKLSQISTSCERFLEVEPADPRDLTFTKIRETVEGFAEDLHIWSHVANLDGLARIDKSMRPLVDAASDVLDRLLERVTALRGACANARPKDLKMPEMDDDDDLDVYGDDDDVDPTKAPGFVISSLLHSVGVQMRQLKLLSPSLQEATPDVEDEMRNVARLVQETGKYFGSDAALARYPVDPKFAGNAALVEARFAAGGNCLCGGPPAGGGAAKLCAYGSGGALSRASSVAGFSGGGSTPDTSSRASSEAASMSMRDGGAAGAGVASVDGGGMVLCLRAGCALRAAATSLRVGGACSCCASWASSSSSQCLICRWYWMIRRAFCVFGAEGFPGMAMLCFGSLSRSSSAMRRAMAVCWRAESSFSPRCPLAAAAARFLFLGLMATLDGS